MMMVLKAMSLLFWQHRIPTQFNERKAAAAAAFLLNAAGGKMQYIRLLKLLYLADRAAWDRYGRPITGDDYASMDQGPVLSKTYDLIKAEGAEQEPQGPWHATVERVGRYDVALRQQPDYGPLSEAELEILQGVYEQFGGYETWALVRHLHDVLAEWTNPKGTSITISPEDILKAVGKAEQIKAVREDLEELASFRRSLGVP